MKQYVVTDAEFDELLRTLELHQFKGSRSLQTNVAIEIDNAIKETRESGLASGISERMTDFVMHDAYRTFLYHVHTWIQKEKA